MFTGDNPIAPVELPPMTRKTPPNLTVVQANTILRLMQYPEREIALIMISTGISVSETCALQWKHINPTRATICRNEESIPPSSMIIRKRWSPDGIVDVNGLRRRTVLLAKPLLTELMKLRRRRHVTDPDSLVIAAQTGAPLRLSNVRKLRVKQIRPEMEMPWLSWQVLKRAHLSMELTDELVLSARYP